MGRRKKRVGGRRRTEVGVLLERAARETDPERALGLCETAVARAEALLTAGALRRAEEAAPGSSASDLAAAAPSAGEDYLEARHARAHALGGVGREGDALMELLAVLGLDPSDRFGLSHGVLGYLLRAGAHPEADAKAKALLASHPCGCAGHRYAEALLLFKGSGSDDAGTREALKTALGRAPFAPLFFLGVLPMPEGPPTEAETLKMGAEERELMLGASAAVVVGPSWAETPGAFAWLKEEILGLLRELAVGEKAPGEAPEEAFWELGELLFGAAGRNPPGANETESPAWEEAEAGLLFWREKEDEDPALARYKDGLEGLIEDRALGLGLEVDRGTAPFPVGLPDGSGGVSPMSYVRVLGTAGDVVELAGRLWEHRVEDFTASTPDPEAAEALGGLGLEVFSRGPAGSP